jgi:hypothetical protein
MCDRLPYPGNCSGNVNRDAKYSIRHGSDGGWQIEIIYYIGSDEYKKASTREHPRLTKLVNDAKDAQGGTFYINEFRHVLVRLQDGIFICAGRYDGLLEFEIDGAVISAEPPLSLKTGDDWIGHHVGRPYILAAGGIDIYYRSTTGDHHRKVFLSRFVGADAAANLAGRLAGEMGNQGGRFYINERKHLFCRASDGFKYLGALGDAPWFPEPPICESCE